MRESPPPSPYTIDQPSLLEALFDRYEELEQTRRDASRRFDLMAWAAFGCIVAVVILLVMSLVSPHGKNGVWQILLLMMGAAALVTMLSLPSLGAARTVAKRQLKRFCVNHGVANLPGWPPPVIGEQFGDYRVVSSEPTELHLLKPRVASFGGLWRLAGVIASVAFATYFSLSIGVGGASILNFGTLFSIGGCVASALTAMSPFSLQWLVTHDQDGPRLSIEIIRFFFFRDVIDLRPSEAMQFQFAAPNLMIRLADARGRERILTLGRVGLDEGGRWRTRRLVRAVLTAMQREEDVERLDPVDVRGT